MMNDHVRMYDWRLVLPIIVIHTCAVASPFLVSSVEGWVCFGALTLYTGFGVTVGYHRYLTHKGFETYPWMRRQLAVAGSLSGEGPPIFWVGFHLKHHQFSDTPDDPHSPRHGFWHAHLLWMVAYRGPEAYASVFKYAKTLAKEPFMQRLSATYVWWQGGLLALLLLGGAVSGWFLHDATWGTVMYYALSWAGLGFFTRMAFVLNTTWAINSACHMWGYRNYDDTGDDSRNFWPCGILAFGEGWHNNHHKYQNLARHGHRWWEIDPSYYVIKLLQCLGLVWNVKDAIPTPGSDTG